MALNFRLIEIATAIAKLGSFSKAAEELYISQPALSQYIQRAENELGYPLFIRERGTCIPTTAGKILVQKGEFLLHCRDDLIDEMSNAASLHNEVVRLGMANGYTQRFFSSILRKMLDYNPQIHLMPVEDYTNHLIRMLWHQEVDVVLMPVPPVESGISQRLLRREELLLAVPEGHPANARAVSDGERKVIDLAQVGEYPFVIVKDAPRFTNFCNIFFREAGVSPKIIFQPDSWPACDTMVAAGMGISLVPDVTAESSKTGNHYYYLKSKYPTYRILTVSYLKEGRPSDAVEQVISQMEDMFGDELVGKQLSELEYPLSPHGR